MLSNTFQLQHLSPKVIIVLTLFLTFSAIYATDNQTITDFNLNAAQNIDLRIAYKHDIKVNRFVFNSAIDLMNLYERNPDCWAYDLDLTCASPYNSREGKKRAGTLITPRHVLLAAHYSLQNGDSIRFIAKNNQIIRRKIIANSIRTDVGSNQPDIQVALLDSDVPASITACQFLPANYSNYLANKGAGLPTLFLDQTEKAAVGEVMGDGWDFTKFYQQYPTLPNRLALNLTVIVGDSGNPVFLVLNNKLVLLGLFTFGGAGSGTSLTYINSLPNGGTAANLDQSLNDIIKETDTLAGINTGYKVTFFDFSAPISAGVNSVNATNSISVNRRTLEIKLENSEKTEIIVSDLFGRTITNQITQSSTFNYYLPIKGVYLISILNNGSRYVTKVIAN